MFSQPSVYLFVTVLVPEKPPHFLPCGILIPRTFPGSNQTDEGLGDVKLGLLQNLDLQVATACFELKRSDDYQDVLGLDAQKCFLV